MTYEPGSKVCFYSHQDINDNSLNYQFMEDNSLVNIAFQNISQEESEINELMMNEEKRRAYNLDSVFLQFQAAKKSLLQLEEDPLFEEDNDDFDF